MATPRKKAPKKKPVTSAEHDTRRERILEAALQEFTARGYELASTNAIAASADVAKGLVFHYFASKEALFEGVFSSVIDRFTASLDPGDKPLPADLFERLQHFSLMKLRAAQENPAIYQFVMLALRDAPAPLRERLLAQQAQHMARVAPKLFQGIDTSKLRPGLSLSRAYQAVTLLSEGISQAHLARLAAKPDRGASELEQFAREQWSWFELLRDGLYGTAPMPPAETPKR